MTRIEAQSISQLRETISAARERIRDTIGRAIGHVEALLASGPVSWARLRRELIARTDGIETTEDAALALQEALARGAIVLDRRDSDGVEWYRLAK